MRSCRIWYPLSSVLDRIWQNHYLQFLIMRQGCSWMNRWHAVSLWVQACLQRHLSSVFSVLGTRKLDSMPMLSKLRNTFKIKRRSRSAAKQVRNDD